MYIYDGSLVAKLYPTLVTLWTVACRAPLSMGFSRQEYWNVLPFPSPGDLPDPEIEPGFPHGLVGKKSTCNGGDTSRCKFNHQVRKIPWRRTWQLTPVFLPGESP